MRIEWAALCRYAEDSERGTVAVGISSAVSSPLPTIPIEIPLHVIITIADLYELPALDRLTCRVIGPDGQEVFKQTWMMTLEMTRPEEVPDGFEPRHTFPLEVRFIAMEAGPYFLVFESPDSPSYQLSYIVVGPQETV